MPAQRACVCKIDEDPSRELSLNVQVELLDVRRLIRGVGSYLGDGLAGIKRRNVASAQGLHDIGTEGSVGRAIQRSRRSTRSERAVGCRERAVGSDSAVRGCNP